MRSRKCKGKFCLLMDSDGNCAFMQRASITTSDGKKWSMDMCYRKELEDERH